MTRPRETEDLTSLSVESYNRDDVPIPSIADSLLDRVVHTAHKIVLRGESMRKLRAKRRT